MASEAREVLVFAGTTEGRELVSWLSGRGTCAVVACAATAYGASLLAGPRVTALEGPLSADQKRQLVEEHLFVCVVDATHAYATHISASVDELAVAAGLDVVRVVREEEDDAVDLTDDTCVRVASMTEAAQYVAKTCGNVLLTTGTKDLGLFVDALPDAAERLYVRVLPVSPSLVATEALGIPARHVVAMQGPFSVQLNRALIEELDVRVMVTKESGKAGGFAQKVRAAQACGIELVVVERPPQPEGVSLDEAKRVLEVRYGL